MQCVGAECILQQQSVLLRPSYVQRRTTQWKKAIVIADAREFYPELFYRLPTDTFRNIIEHLKRVFIHWNQLTAQRSTNGATPAYICTSIPRRALIEESFSPESSRHQGPFSPHLCILITYCCVYLGTCICSRKLNSTQVSKTILFYKKTWAGLSGKFSDNLLSIILVGITHVCEAFIILIRYLKDDWELKQCNGWLKLLTKSMTGDKVAQQIFVILSAELGIAPHFIVAAMRDGASINDVAMRTIKVLYNQRWVLLTYIGSRWGKNEYQYSTTSAKPLLVCSPIC